jgi:integrase
MADAPYAANRTIALLSKFFNWCEAQGIRPDHSNPCRHVEKYGEDKRERFLSAEELARLGQVLDEEEKRAGSLPWIVGAIRLLIFTGARLNEILTLRWDHVDFERSMLLLADSKTGKKAIYLNPPSVEVLRNLPRLAGNPYVICGGRAGRHLINLEKPWRSIRAKAQLDNVRLHDLRHSYASIAAGVGLSLPVIGKLLGHSQPQTTARYSHLSADPLRKASWTIGDIISISLSRRSSKPSS